MRLRVREGRRLLSFSGKDSQKVLHGNRCGRNKAGGCQQHVWRFPQGREHWNLPLDKGGNIDVQENPGGQARWPLPSYLPLPYSRPSSGTTRLSALLQSPLPFLESTASDRQPGEQQVEAGKGPSALPEGGMGPQLGLVGLPGGWLLHQGGIPLLPQSQLRPALLPAEAQKAQQPSQGHRDAWPHTR